MKRLLSHADTMADVCRRICANLVMDAYDCDCPNLARRWIFESAEHAYMGQFYREAKVTWNRLLA